MPSPQLKPCKYPYIPYILEMRIIGRHVAADTIYWFIFVEIVMLGSVKLFYFCKSDVSAVQGHPRSLILAPIESAYATSY